MLRRRRLNRDARTRVFPWPAASSCTPAPWLRHFTWESTNHHRHLPRPNIFQDYQIHLSTGSGLDHEAAELSGVRDRLPDEVENNVPGFQFGFGRRTSVQRRGHRRALRLRAPTFSPGP